MNPDALPRLLYVGDVPVEASYHGSALVHRLLRRYPSQRLLIVESGELESQPSRRLNGADYRRIKLGSRIATRMVRTRFTKIATGIQLFLAQATTSRIHDVATAFAPQAVLTVAHGYSWIAAARVARHWNIPLHMIIHDDFPNAVPIPGILRRYANAKFSSIYRQSASRLCVSPAMAEEYERRYAVPGTLLYPSQGPELRVPDQARPSSGAITVAYAGSISVGGYASAIRALAKSLQPMGGNLIVFGPFTSGDMQRFGLDLPNVVLRGLVDNARMSETLRNEADVVFLPMSFEEHFRIPMSLSFPSKMTDYTAAGVPMLIRAPAYSSAVRWSTENPGCAEVVSTESDADLAAALRRLGENPEYRERLAARASAVGKAMFGFEAVTGQFLEGLAHAHAEAASR